MDTIEIKMGKRAKKVNAPESWDDLDARTALLYYQTLFTGTGNEQTAVAFTAVKLISLTQHIMGFPTDVMSQWEETHMQRDRENGQAMFLDELKQVVTAALGGLFVISEDEETGATTYAVKFNRTKNMWPALASQVPAKGGGKKRTVKWYYAPADGLQNLTLYELAYTFQLYENYMLSRDEVYANRLIGALYRPSRPETREERESAWHGDRRQPLRRYEGKVADRAKMAAELPALTRRFIAFWFASCREQIVKAYPKVFRRGNDADGGSNYGWGGVLLQLAETGTFGNLDTTSDQHFSNALTYMSMKEDERREQEKAIEKAKKRA